MNHVLISGANRGLGLEFTKQFAQKGWRVFACCRNPQRSDRLNTLKVRSGVSVHQLDVTDEDSVATLARTMAAHHLDLLINNAGVYGHRGELGAVDFEEWHRVFDVNAMGPLRLSQAFLPHLEKGEKKIIASITSKMGSMTDNTSGGSYIYRSSKAALNSVAKSLACDLAPRGIISVVFHPGWVQTDMGGPNAMISASQSVAAIIAKIENLKLTDSGKFLNYDGTEIPW